MNCFFVQILVKKLYSKNIFIYSGYVNLIIHESKRVEILEMTL